MDEQLEFAGAGEGAFDAVAHGRDFAADRLADIDDGVGGDVLRLGQPGGDVGDRAGDDPHLLRAPDHGGDRPDEADRQEEEEGEIEEPGEPSEIRRGTSPPMERATPTAITAHRTERPMATG